MKEYEKITKLLREKGKKLEIPEGLQPERMREKIEEYEEHTRKIRSFRNRKYQMMASAASICLIAGVLFFVLQMSRASDPKERIQAEAGGPSEHTEEVLAEEPEAEQETLNLPESSYEEIYACLSEIWKRSGGYVETEVIFGEVEELASADSAPAMQKLEAFGRTNTRTEEIDEADQIKNDGRYLYQIAYKKQDDASCSLGIQILDTEGGLHETAFLDGFTSVEEFYVWEDLLITIENKYYDLEPSANTKGAIEDLAVCGLFSQRQGYHEISIYQISDRSCPKKQKTFTLQGFYESSRIAEGYFYEISRFAASPGEGAQDYDAYIPVLDGNRIEASKIYCPPDAEGTDYLVFVSIDLSAPSSFTDSRAVVAGSGTYYMSADNLYTAWYQSIYQRDPDTAQKVQDVTKLLRFRYWKGRFYAQAEGEVPGNVESGFSMDEYEGDLRIALTVQTGQVKAIIDDRTREHLGFDYEEITQTNALYILDSSLDIKGKLEGLAEDETIRSVRFLGDTGYFVTFRQTDPLFAVDLSDPEHPGILGELKVSGFSEYLHFYEGEHMFGLGMEADEETGQEQGIKLSMFDLTDPADLKEVSRLRLKDYSYSEALWDHRAILIDPAENIIGFQAEGNGHSTYFLFSYEEGNFVQQLKIEAESEEERFLRTRGTFIGDTFYLLRSNGSVQSYDRNAGTLLETVEPLF